MIRMKHLRPDIYLYLAAVLMPANGLIAQPARDCSPVHVWSRAIIAWASGCSVDRGYVRIDDPLAGKASHGSSNDVPGRADNIVVSLGDGGTAVVSFGAPFGNRPGPDFAVFENSFDGRYLELAFVEVSSDSSRWVRFPSRSLTPSVNQTGPFGITDPALINNLAGKFQSLYGTPFWLEDVADSSGLDINNIMYIRIIDVIGSVNPLYASYDSEGNIINDPWPTPFPQSGFDLDAVALLDMSLVGIDDTGDRQAAIYPVPAGNFINVEIPGSAGFSIRISDIYGRVRIGWLKLYGSQQISIEKLEPGIYIAEMLNEAANHPVIIRFIKSTSR